MLPLEYRVHDSVFVESFDESFFGSCLREIRVGRGWSDPSNAVERRTKLTISLTALRMPFKANTDGVFD